MSDRWRGSYDAWKTREPDEAAEVCPTCGGWMYRCHGDWYCEVCEDNMAPEPDP